MTTTEILDIPTVIRLTKQLGIPEREANNIIWAAHWWVQANRKRHLFINPKELNTVKEILMRMGLNPNTVPVFTRKGEAVDWYRKEIWSFIKER